MFQKSGWRDAGLFRERRFPFRALDKVDHPGQFGWGQSCWMPLMILVKQAPERAQDGPGDLARPTAVRNRVA